VPNEKQLPTFFILGACVAPAASQNKKQLTAILHGLFFHYIINSLN